MLPVIADRYELQSLAREDGMASVYRGFDRILGRAVAVKTLSMRIVANPYVARLFRQEAMAAARLRSRYIAAVYDHGIDGDVVFIVQELVDGPSLGELTRDAPLPVPRAVRLLLDICTILDEIHFAGLVHRDIKPDNFAVERDRDGNEHPILLDFGLVKMRDLPWEEVTQPGSLFGTPVFMAPEQWQCSPDVDARADLYALGGMAFALLLGRRPFELRGNIMEQMLAVVNEPAPSLRSQGAQVSPELDAVVLRCLAKNPDDRFASALAVRDALSRTPEARA